MIRVGWSRIVRGTVGLILLLELGGACPIWGEDERSVWGIASGSSFHVVSQAMAQRECRLIQDITALDMGRMRRSLFVGAFFDRPCSILVTFRDDAMVEFQFRFLSERKGKNQDEPPMLGNYNDLTLKLRSKYGYLRETSPHDGGETQTWSVDGMTISLACDRRSATNHTTVLTYRFF